MVVNASMTLAVIFFVAASQWGCRTLVDRPETAAEISTNDFNRLEGSNANLDIVQVPPSVFSPDEVRETTETEKDAQGEKVTTVKSLVEKNADGSERVVIIEPVSEDIRIKVGGKWTIDSLVGQINGRPVYASKFMQSIEDRILRIVAENQRPVAQRMIAQLVSERFEQYINNELIIAEAEGLLSPEMQAGIFAWLQSIQEQTVAGYGGNRTAATQSLQDQFGMNMEQYLKEKRDEALAQDLLRRRVKPRTIVSWRDVERQYSILEPEFNPEPMITIGRIRLKNVNEDQIQDVQARFKRGETFAQVAAELKEQGGLADKDAGVWEVFKMPPNGIAGLDFSQDIKDLLSAVETGKVSAESRKDSSCTWYCVMNIESQTGRSIFDSVLQRQMRRGLEDQRGRYEQVRYLGSLRDRFVTNDIDQMTRRLTRIAWDRYMSSE